MLFRCLIISALLMSGSWAKNQFLLQERKKIEKTILQSLDFNRFTNLYGLPGIGKTTISKQIREILKKRGTQTIWLNWDVISIDEQIKNILTKKKSDSFDLIVKKNKTLVIFIDNYSGTDLSEIDKKLKISSTSTVRFVISSRQKIFGTNSIQMPPFSEEEAISLMLKYFPSEGKQRLKKIAFQLRLYPYWLTNICIAIERSNTLSLNRLESILQSNPKDILNMDFAMIKNLDMEHSLGHQAIKEILIDLKKTDANAYRSLGFISLLDSKSIPLQLIHDFIGDEKEGDRIIEKLSLLPMFSIVNKKNKYITYDLHEITQKIIFETLSESDLSEILDCITDAFIKFYDKDFPSISLSNDEDKFFFNHLFSVIDKFKNDPRVLPLRILAIKRSIYSGQTSKMEFKESIRIDKLLPEKKINNKSILFEYYVDWSYLYCFGHGDEKKKFQNGIEYGKKALEIAKKNQDQSRIFKAATRLIWVHLYAGEVNESKFFLEMASELLPQIVDPYLRKEYFFASSWYYLDAGKFKESLNLSYKGVEIDDLSKSIYVGLYIRCFKAVAEYRLGLIDDAKKTLEEALRREYSLFENNSSLARAELLQTKSMVSLEENKLKLSEQEILESINIYNKEYGSGPYHPKAVSMRLLSDILFKKGELDKANSMISSTIRMFKELIKEGGDL
jgi:tRNA uridine 5-carbamoylmethylation protein Kti12